MSWNQGFISLSFVRLNLSADDDRVRDRQRLDQNRMLVIIFERVKILEERQHTVISYVKPGVSGDQQ